MENNNILPPSARAYAKEPNYGARGFHPAHHRTDSTESLVHHQYPRSDSTEPFSKPSREEEEEALYKRYVNWHKMRKMQQAAIARKLSLPQVGAAVAGFAVLHKVINMLGFKTRIVAPLILLVMLGAKLFQCRAQAKRFPRDANPLYYNFPLLGEIGIVLDTLKMDETSVQKKLAEHYNYATAEISLFGSTPFYNHCMLDRHTNSLLHTEPNEYWLMDPEDRKYMLRTNWKNFVKNLPNGTGFQEYYGDLVGRGLLSVDGDEWYDQRKAAVHMFTAHEIKFKMERSFTEHGYQLADLLRQKVGAEIDLQDAMADLTFDTICDIALGAAPGSLLAEMRSGHKIDFLVQFDRAQELSALRLILPPLVWKTLRFLNLGTERQLSKDCVKVREYVRQIVKKHDNVTQHDAGHDDLLSLYVKIGRETGKRFMLEEDFLIDAAIDFIINGRDASAFLLTNLFKVLTTEVEEKMLEELHSVVGPDLDVTWEHMHDLRYCSAVVNEILRLFPPVPFDQRYVLQDDKFPSGMQVKAGDVVSIGMVAIGRDPNLFQNPEAFQPERWMMDENKPVDRPDEFVFPVFWGGPRLCLGKDMARLQALNVAYTLLKQYTFQVLPHSEKTVNGPVQFYAHGLPVKVRARGKTA